MLNGADTCQLDDITSLAPLLQQQGLVAISRRAMCSCSTSRGASIGSGSPQLVVECGSSEYSHSAACVRSDALQQN